MADETPPDPLNTRRRRPPPVIDLRASEVPAEAAASPPEQAASPDLPPEAAAPGVSEMKLELASEAKSEAQNEPKPEPKQASERRPSSAFEPQSTPMRHLGAAAAGIAGALLVALLFWLGGAFTGARDAAPDLSPRLAAIEAQLKQIAARPAPVAIDPKALDDIAARLGKLEALAASPRAPVTDPVVLGRLTASENAAKSLADNVAALSRRAEATDAAIKETNASIAKLTAVVAEVQNTVKQAAAGSDRASRFAVAASTLRGAVERGDPFTAELAIVKPLTADANAIAWLEPFAAAGVPSNAALGQELAALVRPLLQANETAPPASSSGSYLEKLQAHAEKLVRIRPVNEEPRGDDRAAMLSRIEQRASRGDIAGARAELAKLQAEALAPLQSWIGKADARAKALEASRKLSADAFAALKASP
jgi:hypothetical protein